MLDKEQHTMYLPIKIDPALNFFELWNNEASVNVMEATVFPWTISVNRLVRLFYTFPV